MLNPKHDVHPLCQLFGNFPALCPNLFCVFHVVYCFFINDLVFFSRFFRGKDRVFVISSSCCGHLAAGS